MILKTQPLPLASIEAHLPDIESKKPLRLFLKKFAKLSEEKAKKLLDELRKINNPRLKEAHLIKLVDFLPADFEEINKVVPDAGLTEAEGNALLEVISRY